MTMFGAALRVFQATARRIVEGAPELRPALPPTEGLRAAARAALSLAPDDEGAARDFFMRHFVARPLAGPAFLTGYYEPVVAGSLIAGADYRAPILARPADLVSFAPGEGPEGFDAARRCVDGSLKPYPERAEIEDAAREPIVWLARRRRSLPDPGAGFCARKTCLTDGRCGSSTTAATAGPIRRSAAG